jgi:hypothetical protein
MRRWVWVSLFLVLTTGLTAAADCGCAQGAEPPCYVTFRSNEAIGFSTVFPVEYFVMNATTETPFVLGWMITAADGAVVRGATFDDVVGWLTGFEWDLRDEAGREVAPGFYQIAVLTTAGPVVADVRIVSCCNPCVSCWSCCVCTSCPGAGGRCPTVCGAPYLALSVAATKSCCGFGVTFHWEWTSP